MEQDQKIKKQMLSVSVLAFLGVLILIVVIVMLAGKKDSQQKEALPDSAMNGQDKMEAPTGTLGMTIQGGKKIYSKGQTITLFVYADSYGKEVEAYDIVLRYSKNNLRLEEVNSAIDGIDIYDTEDQVSETHSELIITGVKDLSNNTRYVFNKTALVEVTFLALASGDADLTLVYEKGSKRDSNLVDGANNDILNTVLSETLQIK